jgi:hypothetical protein
MSFGQPSAPSPSDISAQAIQTANAQQPLMQQAQTGSQYNQVSPYGKLTYTKGPGGVNIATTTLSPTQQSLYDALTGTQKQAGQQAAGALGFGQYGTVDPTQKIGDIASGLTGQGMTQGLSFLQPFFTTQTDQLDTKLRNQGLQPGNPAYDVAMRQLQTNQGLQVNNMMESLFPAEQQFAMNEWGLPLKTAESLAQFGAPSSPTTGFTNALPALQAPNVSQDLSTMNQAAWNQYQSQQAQYNAMISAIGGIGGAVLGGPIGAKIGSSLGGALAGPSQFT